MSSQGDVEDHEQAGRNDERGEERARDNALAFYVPDSQRATVERSTNSLVASCCCESPFATLNDFSESANDAPMCLQNLLRLATNITKTEGMVSPIAAKCDVKATKSVTLWNAPL